MNLDLRAARAFEHCNARYDAMLQLVEALVATPSHTDDVAGVALCFDVLDAGLRSLGFEVARPEAPEGRPHLLATRPGAEPSAPTVLCLGHVDTLFNADYPGGAFAVHGSRAVGAGVADMKAGLVTMVAALEALVAAEAIDQFRIRVLVTSDKEQGAVGSRELIRRIATEADVALVFGPADEEGGIVHSRSGTGTFRVTMLGVSAAAQAQSPDGRNAIVELAHMIPELEELSDTQRGVLLNCGIVHGGVRTGVVPAEATLDIEVWCDGPTDQRWVQNQMVALVERASHGNIKATLSGGFTRPPWPLSARTDALVEAWVHAAKVLGFEPPTGTHSRNASDANLTHAATVPTLDGLGARGGDFHTASEWAAVQELPLRATMSAVGLLAWFEDRGGKATWRVGGLIQGETPEDGSVAVSEEDEGEPTAESEGLELAEAAVSGPVDTVADEPVDEPVDESENEESEDEAEGGEDVFNQPGSLELADDEDEESEA